MKHIDISQINAGFEEIPRDEKMLDLLGKAYRGEISCYHALIATKGIQPFSDYKPDICPEMINWFEKKFEQWPGPEIFVYENDGKFIMSDDYNAYYLFLEHKVKEIPCVIMGESGIKYVLYKSEPFKLPPPTIEVIN